MSQVTATVRDPNGNLYTNAKVEAIFIPFSGATQLSLASGSVFPTFTVNTTDSFGVVSMSVTGNDLITPAGSQWRFSVISSTTPTVGFSVSITITGSTQDISAALQAAAAPLPLTTFGSISATSLTVTGAITAQSLSGIRFVSLGNPQGWAGTDVTQWINSAFTNCTNCHVYVSDGAYPTGGTTITIPAKSWLELGPNVSIVSNTTGNVINMTGPNAHLSGAIAGGSIISGNGTGNVVLNIAASCNDCLINDIQFGGGGGAQTAIATIQDNQRFLTFRNVFATPSGGECIKWVPGASGGINILFDTVRCTGSVNRAWDFQLAGSTNIVGVTFRNTYADLVTGSPGVGYDISNIEAAFYLTDCDGAAICYRVNGSSALGSMSWYDCDTETSTVGWQFNAAGNFLIRGGSTSVDGTPVQVAAAGANTRIENLTTQGTTGANSITYSAASTGTHILSGEAGLDKPTSDLSGTVTHLSGGTLNRIAGQLGVGLSPSNAIQATFEIQGSGDTTMRFDRAGSTDWLISDENGAGNNCTGSAAGDACFRLLGHNFLISTNANAAFKLDTSGNGTFLAAVKGGSFATASNCAVNSASPAACGSAASGAVVVPTTTTTYTVNTTAVTANSVILITPRTYTGNLPSAPTCTVPAITSEPVVSAISAGVSFTFTLASTAGQTCWNYWIVN